MIRLRAAVILIEGDRILLVKHSKGDREYWVLPGGGVEGGESLADAATREIREETNLEIKPNKLAFISEAIPADKHRHVIDFFFTGEIISGEIKKGKDRILKDVRFFSVSDLHKIRFYPDIIEEIEKGYETAFSGPIKFLGNRWHQK